MRTVLAEIREGGFREGNGFHGNRLANGLQGGFLHTRLGSTWELNGNTGKKEIHSKCSYPALGQGGMRPA